MSEADLASIMMILLFFFENFFFMTSTSLLIKKVRPMQIEKKGVNGPIQKSQQAEATE
jgi:hypothetical protein